MRTLPSLSNVGLVPTLVTERYESDPSTVDLVM